MDASGIAMTIPSASSLGYRNLGLIFGSQSLMRIAAGTNVSETNFFKQAGAWQPYGNASFKKICQWRYAGCVGS